MEERDLEEFIGFLANIKGHGEITIYRYALAMRDFDPNKLSQDYINEYIKERKNDSKVRGAMLSFFEFAGIKKEFDMPPKSTGRKAKRVKRDVSREEYNAVSKYLYSKSFRDGLLFSIIYEGALRISDVKSIRLNSFLWNDFLKDPQKPCKLIVRGKGKKGRTVLINYGTMEKLYDFYARKINLDDEEQFKDFTNSPTNLFLKDGKPLTEYQIWKIIRYGSINSIGRNIRPHELRSTRATELAEMGIPIQQIKTYLGHSSVATTEIYLHQDDKKTISNIQDTLIKNQ